MDKNNVTKTTCIDIDDFYDFCEETKNNLEEAEKLLIGYEGMDKYIEKALSIIQDVIYDLK